MLQVYYPSDFESCYSGGGKKLLMSISSSMDYSMSHVCFDQILRFLPLQRHNIWNH